MSFLVLFSPSFRRILPILVSSLTFFRVFLDSLYVFYFLLFWVARSLSFHPIFTQNPLSTNLNYNNNCCYDYNNFLLLTKYKKYLALRVLLLSELIRYCKILIIAVQLQPHQFDFPLKTWFANYLLTRLHIF